MESKKILVTGAAGMMGSWLVDELIKRGHEVTAVDDLSGGYIENINKDCKFHKLDLRDTEKVLELFTNNPIDMVYHLAAYAAEGQSIFSPISINSINLIPMNNLLVAAINNNVQRFVFTSSMAVYGDQKPPFNEDMRRIPEDPYGVAKSYCEQMLEIFSKSYGLEYVIIRPHNVYGPRQNLADPFRNVLGIWINRIMRKKPPIIYGDGEQRRAFSYIEDVTPSIANAGFYQKSTNQIINVGSEEHVSINEACRIVLESIGSDMKPIHEKGRLGEVKLAYCTVDKSIQLLEYRTKFNLKSGIKNMLEWAKIKGPQEPSYRLPLEITRGVPKVWLEKSM